MTKTPSKRDKMTNNYKTPEELATEYADKKHNYNPNFPRDVQRNFDVWLETYEDFLAGYNVGLHRQLGEWKR